MDEKASVSFYLNDLKRTGISDAYKNGTRITLVEQPPFVGLNHSKSLSAGVLLPVYGFQRVRCT